MRKLNGCISFIEDDELLDKNNGIWNKMSIVLRKNLIADPSTIKYFCKPK